MDDSASKNNPNPYDRSEEEVSWDEEFADLDEPKESGYPTMLADLAKLVVKVPTALIQLPMLILPEDTARHARAAAREGFLALRSLLAAVADGIENMLAEPSGKSSATVAGPAGTWGTGRHNISTAPSPSPTNTTPPGKARRIEISDEVSERGGGSGEPTVNIDDLSDQEGRGLRADIDY